jgi:hypothetical protein
MQLLSKIIFEYRKAKWKERSDSNLFLKIKFKIDSFHLTKIVFEAFHLTFDSFYLGLAFDFTFEIERLGSKLFMKITLCNFEQSLFFYILISYFNLII